MRQRKTLPKKADNAEVIGQPSHDDSEGTTRISTEDSTWGLENCPKCYVKYREVSTAQSKTTTSTKLRIKEHKYGHHSWHRHTARSDETRNQGNIMSGSFTYPGPTGVPKPVPES